MKLAIGLIMVFLSPLLCAEERMINLKHTFNGDKCHLSTFFNDPLRIDIIDNRLLKYGGMNGCETHVNHYEFSKNIKFCAIAKVSDTVSTCKVSIEGFSDNKTMKFTNYINGNFSECLYSCLTSK